MILVYTKTKRMSIANPVRIRLNCCEFVLGELNKTTGVKFVTFLSVLDLGQK